MANVKKHKGIMDVLRQRYRVAQDICLFINEILKDLKECVSIPQTQYITAGWCSDEHDPRRWPARMNLWVCQFADPHCRLELLLDVVPEEFNAATQRVGTEGDAMYLAYLDYHATAFTHDSRKGPVTPNVFMDMSRSDLEILQAALPHLLNLPIDSDHTKVGDGFLARFLGQ